MKIYSLSLFYLYRPGKLFGKFFLIILLISVPFRSESQYYKKLIEKLASEKYHGRGYYKNGDVKAAQFLKKEFQKAGLYPVNGQYLQPFSFPVNTFPGKTDVTIGTSKLIPGKDFIVSPACPAIKGTFPVVKVQIPFNDTADYSNVFLMFDKTDADSIQSAMMDSLMKNPPTVKGLLIVETKKLIWSVSTRVSERAVVRIRKESLPERADMIKLNIESRFLQEHRTYNVAGYVPGKSNPDSFIVFTAHYDHLGRMGKKTLFAGANDNASGTAMITELARYYARPENRPCKSVLFIAFAGEEAGLLGSKYYTENPMQRLDRIRFLINLDMMGNGSEGMMVVNGEIHPDEFEILNRINNEKALLKTVGKRGKAKNSDHHFFSEKGVPAFFFYTTGGSSAYHDIYDVPKSLPLTSFNQIMTLIKGFVDETGK